MAEGQAEEGEGREESRRKVKWQFINAVTCGGTNFVSQTVWSESPQKRHQRPWRNWPKPNGGGSWRRDTTISVKVEISEFRQSVKWPAPIWKRTSSDIAPL